ncbi:MAG: TSUP family transporter [Sphaerochaetaceae bacterium]|nr:TSUP family transporter [Sphaerochaetaceae bacterium]
MLELEIWQYALLFFIVFLAGFIDSIAGGGGLISLPAYYSLGLPPVYALGNNKFSSTFGGAIAFYEYSKKGHVIWRLALVGAVFSIIGSAIGAQIALRFSDYYLKYLLICVIPVLAFITLKKKSANTTKKMKDIYALFLTGIIGLVVGCYDGFFGPGTGMFLTIAFTTIVGLDTLDACGNTKLMNFASNIAAFTTFVINGNVYYSIGIPCMICSIVGNKLGATLAIKGGDKVVRPLLVVVLVLLLGNILISLF